MPQKGFERHADQIALFKGRVEASGANDFVLIGHSQGGIVSRRSTQEWRAAGQTGRTRAIVTIGTPHQGAPIVTHMAPALRNSGATRTAMGLTGAT